MKDFFYGIKCQKRKSKPEIFIYLSENSQIFNGGSILVENGILELH